MTASSSFMELNPSRPPSFHSPLSVRNTDDARTHPCTDDASSLMKRNVFCGHIISPVKRQQKLEHLRRCCVVPTLCSLRIRPFFLFASPKALLVQLQCRCRHLSTLLSRQRTTLKLLILIKLTSTVSSTLTMPGCLRVLNFLRAFFARGRCDRCAATSKEKILHLEPSSCYSLASLLSGEFRAINPFCAVLKSPY